MNLFYDRNPRPCETRPIPKEQHFTLNSTASLNCMCEKHLKETLLTFRITIQPFIPFVREGKVVYIKLERANL